MTIHKPPKTKHAYHTYCTLPTFHRPNYNHSFLTCNLDPRQLRLEIDSNG